MIELFPIREPDKKYNHMTKGIDLTIMIFIGHKLLYLKPL